MAKGQKRIDKGPKKADDAAKQTRKLAGPKYLRGGAIASGLTLGKPRPTS